MSKFYVYEWFNVDTGEVFYVGKGKNFRYKDVENRNQYFKNYYNKHKCDVRKIKEDLKEQDAFDLEILTIAEYRQNGQCQCNLANGGEGATFPEGSREDICAKLRALYNLRDAMDDMPNEFDYEPSKYAEKTTEQLKFLYDFYYDYKSKIEHLNAMDDLLYGGDVFGGFDTGRPNRYHKYNGVDLNAIMMLDKESKILSGILKDNLINSNSKFKKFKNIKNENDYLRSDVNADNLISEMLKNQHYKSKIVEYLEYVLRCVRNTSYRTLDFFGFEVKSYTFQDRFIIIKYKTKDDKKKKRIELDLYDVVFALLFMQDKTLIEVLCNEILFAPIIIG